MPELEEHPVIQIRGGVIVVSCERTAYSRICRAYPIDKVLDAVRTHPASFEPPLVGAGADGASDSVEDPNNPGELDREKLTDWLMTLTGQSRWFAHGGTSAICVYGDILMVTADACKHDAIEAALRAMHLKAR